MEEFREKNRPDIIGVLTSGLSEVKGDNIDAALNRLRSEIKSKGEKCEIVAVSTPDYVGGLETGYAKAVGSVLARVAGSNQARGVSHPCCINVLAGSHLTPADFLELRGIIESFGLRPRMLSDLSALDGSRQGAMCDEMDSEMPESYCTAVKLKPTPSTYALEHTLPKAALYVPKRMMTLVAPDESVGEIIQSIIKVNKTGKRGDGKIFVSPIESAIG